MSEIALASLRGEGWSVRVNTWSVSFLDERAQIEIVKITLERDEDNIITDTLLTTRVWAQRNLERFAQIAKYLPVTLERVAEHTLDRDAAKIDLRSLTIPTLTRS